MRTSVMSCSLFSQAQLLIGSTILVSAEDKPELEEGEFYSNDLVGMRVIHKVVLPCHYVFKA